jgi:acetyltransferase-like isoleucine patch superfamily enzyme
MDALDQVRVHPSAIVESRSVGAGTCVWAFAHICPGAHVGRDCNIADHVYIEGGAVLGHRVTVKNHVLLFDGLTIEDDVFIGPGVIFTNDTRPRSRRAAWATERYADKTNWLARTHVAPGASIGAGALILGGVTIGAFAMIGAGAVVTRNVEPHALVVGQPAIPVGWVCRCGWRLSRGLVCPECGRQYSWNGEGVLDEEIVAEAVAHSQPRSRGHAALLETPGLTCSPPGHPPTRGAVRAQPAPE